ncbi:hypothetical protein DL768_010003 [Monosporascus sp. mg162]|nr:hypothetical protein DL768_010003 [Monosporascus sp. mg162]
MNDAQLDSTQEMVRRPTSNKLSYTPGGQLSRWSLVLIWGVVPLLVIITLYTSPLTAAFLPFLLMPTLSLLWYDRSHPGNQRTDAETLLWTYALTGTVGITSVVIIQSIISYGAAYLLFQSETDRFFEEFGKQERDIAQMDPDALAARGEMARQPRYWIFLAVFAFVVAGAVEESLKYYALQCARHYGRIAHPKNLFTLAMAAGLGFSTTEGIGFVYATVQEDQPLGRIVQTAAERVALGPVTHALTAGLIGLNVIRRDLRGERLGFSQVIGNSVLFHGGFNFIVMGVTALEGNVGWIHPRGLSLLFILTVAVGFVGALTVTVRRRLSRQTYFEVSVGYLTPTSL